MCEFSAGRFLSYSHEYVSSSIPVFVSSPMSSWIQAVRILLNILLIPLVHTTTLFRNFSERKFLGESRYKTRVLVYRSKKLRISQKFYSMLNYIYILYSSYICFHLDDSHLIAALIKNVIYSNVEFRTNYDHTLCHKNQIKLYFYKFNI